MTKTMRGDRLHIAIVGRKNAGKSSLINALTRQNIAIVSEKPGTTTDPVFKSMELLPIGPVVLVDTAGIDDTETALGIERVKKSREILAKSDLALLLIDSCGAAGNLEDEIVAECDKNKIGLILILNKSDLPPSKRVKIWLSNKDFVAVSAKNNEGIQAVKDKIIEIAPSTWEPPFLRDLIEPKSLVLLATPIDLSAPKGRMIMPQVKAWRDILDGDAIAVSCKESELEESLKKLKISPSLVVTDSRLFSKVAGIIPPETPLTSFSILSIRQKGDLAAMIKSLKAVDSLKAGDKILIAESCTHHPQEDDIGRVKIPKWLNEKVGGGLIFDVFSGADYPENLQEYRLVVHCGACTLNRKEMIRRQAIPLKMGVPITNYGVLISYLHGVFPRALMPFPELKKSDLGGLDGY